MERYIGINEELVEKYLGAFPSEYLNLKNEKQQIAAKIYNLLSGGNPVSIKELAESLDMETDYVKSITDSWTGIYYDESGKKDELLILSLEDAYMIALRRNELQLGEILSTV